MKGQYGHPQAPKLPIYPKLPQLPGMTLRAFVTLDIDDKGINHVADAILARRMGLDPLMVSDGLSGGEARRVSLARALSQARYIAFRRTNQPYGFTNNRMDRRYASQTSWGVIDSKP